MVSVTFIEPDGKEHVVEVLEGTSLMHAAVQKLIPGIEAECGGALACATCHIYVDAGWQDKTGKPSPMEEDMLDFAYDMRENSRLSCQIVLTEALNGLKVHLPETQG